MAAKKPVNLDAAFDAPVTEAPPPAPAPRKKSTAKNVKPSREGTVLVGAHFAPTVQKQLRMIAAEEGTTNKALIGEALNLLFVKKGKTLSL